MPSNSDIEAADRVERLRYSDVGYVVSGRFHEDAYLLAKSVKRLVAEKKAAIECGADMWELLEEVRRGFGSTLPPTLLSRIDKLLEIP